MARHREPHVPAKAGEVISRPEPGETDYDLEFHQGPLPQVDDFAAYNRVLPGAAHRILKMAERDQKALIFLKKGNWLTEFISMLLGKGFLYALVGAAVYLAINDKPLEALFAGLAPIVATIYANVRREDDTRSRSDDGPSPEEPDAADEAVGHGR